MALAPQDTHSWLADGAAPPARPVGDGAIEVVDAEDGLGLGVGTAILVVDDEPTNLVAYEAALAPLGRDIVLAGSGMDALAKLLAQDFALILLDVSMPGLSGLDTARLIRERPRCRGMPIIFITGVTSANDVMLDAYEAGGFDFVSKPVTPELLRAKARVYLQLQDRAHALLRHVSELRAARDSERDDGAAAITARRLEKLQEATAALAEARSPSQVARVAVALGADAVGATASAMWLAQPDGSLVLEASQGLPDGYLDPWRVIPRGASVLAMRVAERAAAIWVETEADFARDAAELLAQARAAGRVLAFAALPLVRSDRVVAVVAYSYRDPHTFPPEERQFLGALVRVCEQALERAQLHAAESEARVAAEAANARKDEFLAMLGHELRNPLSAMAIAMQLVKLRDRTLDRELAIVDRQVTHLTRVVDELVDVSRITQGKINLRREAVELARAVGNTLDELRPSIDRLGHAVVVDVPDHLLVDADRHRLGQVLANLLSNATKYTPDGGRIEIVAEADGAFVRIVVRDNGRGIEPALLPRLFDLFVQGDRALDRAEGGLGVGLTLVRTVVELHGGRIEAHSPGPGAGASFVVRWPSASSQTSTAKLPALAKPSPRRSLRVLVVEDNVDAAESLADLLRSLGHEVAVAYDGAAGIEAARTFGPDLAVLDIGLPVIDGYELARRLRVEPRCEHTLLVALTGYDLADARARSRQAGFAHHLVKPFDMKTLIAVLDAAASDDRKLR